MHEKLIILDFGSQTTQLIGRRVRELNMYCEIVPYNKFPHDATDVKGVILSGSPYSVYDENAFKADLTEIRGKYPVLGICYGAQFLAYTSGGNVEPANSREYGRANLSHIDGEDELLKGIHVGSQIWMSHGDTITVLPDNFKVIASTDDVRAAAYHVEGEKTWGVQFHPEVFHSTDGTKLLDNFLNICGCAKDWTPASFIESTVAELKEQLGDDKVILALSGGVDSSYLLYAAMKYGADVKAYYVKALFQPQFEMDDAMRLAEQLKAPVRVLRADVLSDPVVVSNPSNRCYYCKKVIFNMIMKAAAEDGYTVLLDGTNASDDAGDRPGMKALQELQVKSPLRECGLVKSEIRRLSKEGGLFTWDKPSYACLATRIPTGCEITAEKLQKTEAAEDFLFSLGFSDFRVRMMPNGAARLQLPENQLPLLMEKRAEILNELKKHYPAVLLDLEVRG